MMTILYLKVYRIWNGAQWEFQRGFLAWKYSFLVIFSWNSCLFLPTKYVWKDLFHDEKILLPVQEGQFIF